MPRLMFVRGLREGESVPLAPPGIFLGRETDNDLQLPAEGVSRYHAKLVEADGAWLVSDLGSSNGLAVNRQRVVSHRLADGDLIGLGKVVLRFIADAPPAAAPPPPTPAAPTTPAAPAVPVATAPPAPPPAPGADEASRRRFREREREIERLVRDAVAAKHRRLRRMALAVAVLLNLLLLAAFLCWKFGGRAAGP